MEAPLVGERMALAGIVAVVVVATLVVALRGPASRMHDRGEPLSETGLVGNGLLGL